MHPIMKIDSFRPNSEKEDNAAITRMRSEVKKLGTSELSDEIEITDLAIKQVSSGEGERGSLKALNMYKGVLLSEQRSRETSNTPPPDKTVV
jgi:hypothetical protein